MKKSSSKLRKNKNQQQTTWNSQTFSHDFLTDFHFDSLLYVMSAMMHKFDKFIVDPTVIDHDNMMIEINEKY